MAGQMTQWFCQELLKIAFNRDTYTPSYTSLQVALTLDVPPLNADTSQLLEPVGGAYARVTVPMNTANWTATGFREVSQASALTFPQATDLWGTVTGWWVGTVDTTVQTVATGALTASYRVTTGIQPQLPAGTIIFGLYD